MADSPHPNNYERNNMFVILNTNGGDFFAELLRLIAKADSKNRERLRQGFPHYVACYESWLKGEI